MNVQHSSSNFKKSNARCILKYQWEDAFDKFGFDDGDNCLTHIVADFLRVEGYSVATSLWLLHNETICSIRHNEKELMPCEDADICIGYDDPRGYLPANMIQLLDEYFYD